MLREGLKKVKYLKGGEGSDFLCVLKFTIINIKLGWEGGTRLQAENDVLAMGTVRMLYRDIVCVMKTILINNKSSQGEEESC